MSEHTGRHAAAPRRGRHEAASEQVRFGVPFNGIVPLWHEGTEITWHRTPVGTDLSEVLGLGLVESEPGPSAAPEGWGEVVEVGTLVEAASGPVLRLRAVGPAGKRAINDPGDGVPIPLSAPLSVEEAMAGEFDTTGFAVHIARLMLRAARDGAILLFTLRAPRDPEPHHLLSVPAEADTDGVMHFHLGTLLDMSAAGSWSGAVRADRMTLLDLDVPYTSLLVGTPENQEGLDIGSLVDMARPVVDCILKPGFPFALGCSAVLPESASARR
ncbi:MAG: hypothetical protein Q4C85_07655 [Actinomyces sp.]|uniref:hypothetical protein n=1 Tax=Actinomyces sp. TaxID=29317 RepID=UPI0026DC088F|nr:hypothetical protein [Actinomyces sp.]MDO4243618.1 hypothetical protein [Actinomyces sp.]